MSTGDLIRAMAWRWRGPAAWARGIVSVSVRDHNFKLVKTITSERELAAFREMWSEIIEAEPRLWQPTIHYKLDIQHQQAEHSNRWLYDPVGLVRLVAILRAIWVAPLYKLPSPAEFNKILGLDRQ